MKKSNIVFGLLLAIVLILLIIIMIFIYFEIKDNNINYNDVSEDGTFSTTFIRNSHSYMKNKNYMISPYSVEIALSMLREGAQGSTLDEFNKVVPKRSIKTLIVKDRVNVANSVFIKNIYKDDMISSYMDTMKNDYNADVIYDEFKTPDKINNWVNQETNGMIKKILDQMDPDFVLGLANAVAMEEKWQSPFECKLTTGYAFEKKDGKQFDTAMMSKSFEDTISYYEDGDVKAAILPYKIYNRMGKEDEEGEQLDFIGILPKDVDKYVDSFTLDKMETIVNNSRKASDKLEVYVGLPRFEFSYDFKEFKDALIKTGIKSVFAPSCDLSGMINNHDDLYVSEAIHKSYVKVDEAGTKAAAVTYFGLKDNAAVIEDDKEYVSIIFDKPFVFVIKDHKSNEILFFGVVYEPEKWDSSKECE